MIKVIYLVIFLLTIIISSVVIEIILVYEILLHMFRHLRLGINAGKMLTNKQLKELLELLDYESVEYGVCEKRINIYAYKWQFMPVFWVRIALAYIVNNQEFLEVNRSIINRNKGFQIAYYCENNNFIELYEFNLKAWCKKNNIPEKEYIIKTIFHEYRHKYQFNTGMVLTDKEAELDTENFAKTYYDKNRSKIKEILGEK